MIFANIQRLCEERNITISGLEKACGLGNGTIKEWRQRDPSVGRLQKVAEYFGLTVNDLIIPQQETDKQDRG